MIPNSNLGAYKIIAPLGAGGMGEVYRATDTRLKRDVALKVLPESFASDPERMARFQREAEVLASLNHSNIAQIYGVEHRALVMELVEGDSPKGPMPFDEAWRIASQIAAGLEYAHDKGVVHRDLKPANVKVTPEGTVKLLDFGLAKAFTGQAAVSGNLEDSPTLTVHATQVGMILGTAAYMAPEQARGKMVDKRADIWAFGVVLYELLTGERLFDGEGVTDTVAQVLTRDIDLRRVPAAARPLLQECLQRDPRQRLRDIGDARRLIGQAPTVVAPPVRAGWLPWAAAALMAFVAGAVGVAWWRSAQPPERPLMRLSVDLGSNAIRDTEVTAVLSPDGTRLAYFVKQDEGRPSVLAVRQLDQPKETTTILSGTDDAWLPFFSPDGQWIGYFENQHKLKKISVNGGTPISLYDTPQGFGGSWADDDTIVYSADGKLFRGSSAGGTPQQLPAQGGDLKWPQVLPGTHTVLFTRAERSAGTVTIEALNLDTGVQQTVLARGHSSRYLSSPGGRGFLLFKRDDTLFAVGFDARKAESRGSPQPLVQDIALSDFGGGQYDVSRSGNLVYLSGTSATTDHSVVWMDATGKQTPLISKPGAYRNPRLSPDGKRLAYIAPGSNGLDVWVYDLDRDMPSQLTFTGPGDQEPAWAPDGKHIVYGSASPSALWWTRADGSGQPTQLLETKIPPRPQSISADGRQLAYVDSIYPDIWTVPLDIQDVEHPKAGTPEPYLATSVVEVDATFSPDGRWMAYASNESGREEVFVRQFPDAGGKWKISADGGKFPRWSRANQELLFLGGDDRLMVVSYTVEGTSFVAGKPRVWADRKILRTDVHPNFDLAADGKRVVVLPVSDSGHDKPNLHVTFLLNLADELSRRIPESR